MKSLNPIERAALQKISEIYADEGRMFKGVFESCSVVKRENTGFGFFVDLQPNRRLPAIPLRSPLGDAWVSVDGLRYGVCCLLHLKEGYPTLLEGYSVGGEDTSRIDFAVVEFRISAEPPAGDDC